MPPILPGNSCQNTLADFRVKSNGVNGNTCVWIRCTDDVTCLLVKLPIREQPDGIGLKRQCCQHGLPRVRTVSAIHCLYPRQVSALIGPGCLD